MNDEKINWPDWIKVGQKIKEKGRLSWIATITELTERGFKYKYDTPKPFIAREGSCFTGGEYYIDEALKVDYWAWEPIYYFGDEVVSEKPKKIEDAEKYIFSEKPL